jgi:hypothetical protein
MKVKSAMMVAPGNFTVTSDAGHTIQFEAGKPQFVPGILVRKCLKFGCKEVKRFKDTETDIPATAMNVNVSLHEVPYRPDMEAIEEVTTAELMDDQGPEAYEQRFTPEQNKVRQVINNMRAQGTDGDEFTDDGIPKVGAINKRLDGDFSISAETRDEVWAKMKEGGEVEIAEEVGDG